MYGTSLSRPLVYGKRSIWALVRSGLLRTSCRNREPFVRERCDDAIDDAIDDDDGRAGEDPVGMLSRPKTTDEPWENVVPLLTAFELIDMFER